MKIQFSGSAGYYPYILGIASGLQKRNITSDDFTEIHAYSSGGVVALLFSLDINIEFAMRTLHKFIVEDLNNCATGSIFNFLDILKFRLNIFLDSIDSELYKKANNKLHIRLARFNNFSLSNVFNYKLFKPEIVSKYFSNADLVNACITSGYIPFYKKMMPYIEYRNNIYFDGGAVQPFEDDYFDINVKKDFVRNTSYMRKQFWHYLLISSDEKKIKQMYDIGVMDSSYTVNMFRHKKELSCSNSN